MGFIFPINFNSPQIQESIDFKCNQKTNIPKPKQDPPVSQHGIHQMNTYSIGPRFQTDIIKIGFLPLGMFCSFLY